MFYILNFFSLQSFLQNMSYNPNYAEMFRSRPQRFILPIFYQSKSHPTQNMIKLPNTNAKAFNINNTIHVIPELLCDIGCETPRINYDKCLGKFYRYFYAMSSDVDSQTPGMVIYVYT